MAQRQLTAMVHQLGHHKVQLNVGRGQLGAAFVKSAAFGKVGGQSPLAVLAPFPHGLQGVPNAAWGHADEIGMARGIGHQHHIGVVMQVFTHTRQGVLHRDAPFLQMGSRPNA